MHGFRIEFQRTLADAVFVMDKNDVANVKQVLAKKNQTFGYSKKYYIRYTYALITLTYVILNT